MAGMAVLLPAVLAARAVAASPLPFLPSKVSPPAVPREFRGLWIASVKNLDWPSRPGLTTAQQKAELIALFDQALQLHLNAVVLQVRPGCDALYASTLEPWSEYLTGHMGRAPEPFYDPLAFAVEEAHRRGLELHAWFNPYRARHHTAFSPIAPNHISRTHPSLVRPYGKSLWLDPGLRDVQEYSLGVVLDVVRRYDIDGVHFDDYFYPYPEKDGHLQVLPFPDAPSWKKYKDSGGRLDREDWRRENVNIFMMRVSQSVHAAKPWMRFGISPFGIWRPGYPAQVKGLDSYKTLFADSRRWLREGWVDYLVPQLYWAEERRETSFDALSGWWASENVKQRHVWPGLDLTRVGSSRPATEIGRQIRVSRSQDGSDGNMLWGWRALSENRLGLREMLRGELYPTTALTPGCPWLGAGPSGPPAPPGLPQLSAEPVTGDASVRVRVTPTGAAPIWNWLLQTRIEGAWDTRVLPGSQSAVLLTVPGRAEVVAVSALDRLGNASQSAVVERARAGGGATAPAPAP